jgi:hypothetical protein
LSPWWLLLIFPVIALAVLAVVIGARRIERDFDAADFWSKPRR